MKQFILLFHTLSTDETAQVEFKSDNLASDFIELSKLDGYNMYQYIQSDYTYNMPIKELENENIGFKKLYRDKKTWFGLTKKTVTDLLIEPKNGFYYPYGYGHYLYIFTKKDINQIDFEKWLDRAFPSRFGDIDECLATISSEFLNLLNKDDYLIATNHDYQEQFGISGRAAVIEQIISKFNNSDLKDYDIEKYQK